MFRFVSIKTHEFLEKRIRRFHFGWIWTDYFVTCSIFLERFHFGVCECSVFRFGMLMETQGMGLAWLCGVCYLVYVVWCVVCVGFGVLSVECRV